MSTNIDPKHFYAIDEDDRSPITLGLPVLFTRAADRQEWVDERPYSRHAISTAQADAILKREQERGRKWIESLTPEQRQEREEIMGLE